MDRYQENKGKFRKGTIFIGNVNNEKMKILCIEKPTIIGTETGKPLECKEIAYIQSLTTGNKFSYGLTALEHCDLTILN